MAESFKNGHFIMGDLNVSWMKGSHAWRITTRHGTSSCSISLPCEVHAEMFVGELHRMAASAIVMGKAEALGYLATENAIHDVLYKLDLP